MADLLERVQRELDERLAELRPLVEEARQLEAALAALEHDESAPAPRPAARRTAPKPAPRSAPRRTAAATAAAEALESTEPELERPVPRKGAAKPESDERRKRVLAIVTENPGTTAGNLALLLDTSVAAMGALLKRLEREGKVEKAEKGYSATKTPAE